MLDPPTHSSCLSLAGDSGQVELWFSSEGRATGQEGLVVRECGGSAKVGVQCEEGIWSETMFKSSKTESVGRREKESV